VHVGKGDTLDPMGYVMREEKDGEYLYSIDLEAWIEDHPDPGALAEYFQNNKMTEVRGYIAHNVDPSVYGLVRSKVASRNIFEKYMMNLQRWDSEHQLLIDEAVKNPFTGALIVPGSSIKGAIRTAVIDYFDQEYHLKLKQAGKEMNRILGKVFGRPNEANTFQDLKVGDFEARMDESYVFPAREVRKSQRDSAATPKNDCETTMSLCTEGEPYRIYGTMTLGRVFGGEHPKKLRIQYNGKTVEWELDELLKLCTNFYGKRYFDEKRTFYDQPHLRETARALERVERELGELGAHETILRLGHYSHVECVTITNNKPSGRTDKNTNRVIFGTTRTLANGLYPFGWVKLRLCEWEEYEEALRQKKEHDARISSERAQARQEIQERIRESIRLEQERKRQEQEERERQAQREAELASMSEEERLIHRVEQGEAIENQVIELYFKLDDLDDESRIRAAKAIKARWQQEQKKWTGKLSPKQQKKVAKIRSILGEG
jgi:CRISPR/Cas system CSM-associated protein Csm5 (group 7 of RAMP superfamily)